MALSVIIPVYNEREALVDIVTRLEEILDAEHEIILVDDGSTDGCCDDLLDGSVDNERVIVKRHDTNLGYGRALKTGIRAACHDTIAILDADGTYAPEELTLLLEAGASVDMVVGHRKGQESWEPLIRRMAKGFLRILASWLTNYRIQDLNSGFRIFPKELAKRFMGLLPDGFSFTSTITLALISAGYHVRYVPISYSKRKGRSKIRPIRDTWGFFVLILRMVLYFNPLKFFLPVSVLMTAAGVGVGIYQAVELGNVTTVPTLVTLTGIQLGAIGLLADMISRKIF